MCHGIRALFLLPLQLCIQAHLSPHTLLKKASNLDQCFFVQACLLSHLRREGQLLPQPVHKQEAGRGVTGVGAPLTQPRLTQIFFVQRRPFPGWKGALSSAC